MKKRLQGDARNYACNLHQATNHRYGTHPYSYHLAMVAEFARKYIHLIPEESRNDVLCACWTHDLIEDCRVTYNDIKNDLNETIADLTYALTNDKGKNRAERAGAKYYQGSSDTPFADLIKICDRLANVMYSAENKSSMLRAYQKEQTHFAQALYRTGLDEMFTELYQLLESVPA